MKRLKKSSRICLIVVGLMPLVYLAWGFVWWASYRPERSDAFLWGAYHVHSALSDGIAPPEEIARQARAAGISLVLLADHSESNPGASVFRRVFDGVHMIGGSETYSIEGRLVFFGAEGVPLFKLPPFPPDALDDIREWHGFSVVAYPLDARFPWRYWREDFQPGGIEILNLSTHVIRMSLWEKTVTVLAYPFSRHSLVRYLAAPIDELNKWDFLTKRGKTFCFFALDTHGGIGITPDIILPFPDYAEAFSLLALGIAPHYRDEPEMAIRKGDFFACVRGAGEPQDFVFEARQKDSRYSMGSRTPEGVTLAGRVRTGNLATRMVLLEDGKPVLETAADRLELPEAGAGVYRLEVYLSNHPWLSRGVPWILSNPIWVGMRESLAPHIASSEGLIFHPVPLSDFRIENDDQSTGKIDAKGLSGRYTYNLAQYHPESGDRWVALASRMKRDIAGFEGFYIRAVSDRYLRYFIELRLGERWFYTSFKVYPNRVTECRVPFTRLFQVNKGLTGMSLQTIDSMFISQSNYTSRTGFSARLDIEEMGFYRRKAE